MKKIKIILCIIFCFFIFSCNMVGYYDDINGKKAPHHDIVHDENLIFRIYHFCQRGAVYPFNEFDVSLSLINPKKNDKIELVDIELDVYRLNNKIIEPYKEFSSVNGVTKYYKYSIFFPKEIKEVIHIKYYNDGTYYEYKREFTLTRKRDRSSWDMIMGI